MASHWLELQWFLIGRAVVGEGEVFLPAEERRVSWYVLESSLFRASSLHFA